MLNVDTIFSGALVVSVVVLSSYLGIIVGSYAVTAGADTAQIKLSMAIKKAVVLISAVSAGYLGLGWALAFVGRYFA